MPTYVRVRQPETGHELSMVASAAAAAGLTVLDKPATRADGTPLPMKPRNVLPPATAPESADSKAPKAATSGRKATRKKESS